ncbi:4-hydroxybutyrate coenzyme A transferase [Janibacter sp. HTCC2649]|uniref:acetyl-CoA hydrolase/transferase C-terminal domain-containing protein n=1 Tax=Janibacter sp. HTCC2649 TaxID=313589 RepID=UPI000066EACB|nr:acetyl-CoA hydrolase/transferase C-terminal domain-containing protein [Janibacter sp. HTCC2649]EAP98933.1 4-hydroxybutyrate coenzyme A transferase [Janibacter sp. HTCC2649]
MITSTRATVTAAIRRAARGCDRPLRVVAGGNAAVPWELLHLLDEAAPHYELFMLNAPRGIPTRSGVTHVTPFVGPGMRHGAVSYLPARLSHVPTLLASRFVPDVVLVSVSERLGGRWSLGCEVNILPAALSVCRAAGGLVMAESRADVPFTYGDGELEGDELDVVLSTSPSPAPSHPSTPPAPPSEAIRLIGERVAARVDSGATLQLGIGAIPDAVVPRLTELRRLGVWSEMVADGILDLDDAGALDRDRQVVASFAAGGPRLMSWLHTNSRVRMRRTEIVNDPGRIAAQPAMTSINTALSVDLFDQANGSHVGSRVHSGFGGQCDFVVGAMDSPGGQALMALRAWHPRADVSTIVGLLEGPVTSFQHTAVVTENGTAEIMGWDAKAQARHLIEQAAHPSVRADLWEDAAELGLR